MQINNDGPFWTYKLSSEDEYYDFDFTTEKEAVESAQIRFNQDCSDGDDYKHDQDEEVELIKYVYVDEERVIELMQTFTVSYEYCRDDMDEHGTWHSGGGGVL